MNKNITVWILLFLIIGIAVFMYISNKKDKNKYLSGMLTSLPPEQQQVVDNFALTGERNPCQDQCDPVHQAPSLLFGLLGGGYSAYNCQRCLKLNGLA